jgi:hypothetical protein
MSEPTEAIPLYAEALIEHDRTGAHRQADFEMAAQPGPIALGEYLTTVQIKRIDAPGLERTITRTEVRSLIADVGSEGWRLRACYEDLAARVIGLVDLDPTKRDDRLLVATCVFCGCTDERACEGGCSWVPNDHGVDCCSACIDRLPELGPPEKDTA